VGLIVMLLLSGTCGVYQQLSINKSEVTVRDEVKFPVRWAKRTYIT